MFGSRASSEENWETFEAEAMPLMPDVYRVAYWMVRDRDIAEDLTQETFVQALRSFSRYTIGTNCKAWLLTILYRVNGKRRSKLGKLHLVEDPDNLIAEKVEYTSPIPTDLTDEEIISAVKKLPTKFAQVIVMTDVCELSYKETADVLDVPIGTVMSRIHRGRQMLRQSIVNEDNNKKAMTNG